MFVKLTPLTTRPSRTSRQGMMRSGMAFGVAARARASASETRPSSSARPITQPPTLAMRASETRSLTAETPPEAITRRGVAAGFSPPSGRLKPAATLR